MSSRLAFHIYLDRVEANLDRLNRLEQTSGIKILHTLKSIHHPTLLQMLSQAITGSSVGSKAELQLAKEAKSRHIHLYSPAFSKEEFHQLAAEAHTLSLNSLGQWETLQTDQSSIGLRLNPMLHNTTIPAYCNPNLSSSHLGVDYQKFLERFRTHPQHFSRLEGLHFHALFRSGEEGLVTLLEHIQTHYPTVLPQLRWLNLGGGHALTEKDYNLDTLHKTVEAFRSHYPNITLYLEPGEATFRHTTDFVVTVLDIIPHPDTDMVIVNSSTETHLLDYTIHASLQPILSQSASSPTPYRYKVCGNSCLQGDVIGTYYLYRPLERGDRLVFKDMASYTMSKMTQFNGHDYPHIQFIPKELK